MAAQDFEVDELVDALAVELEAVDDVLEDAAADVDVARVRAAMPAPKERNAHTLSAAAATRERPAAWRRRPRPLAFRDLPSIRSSVRSSPRIRASLDHGSGAFLR